MRKPYFCGLSIQILVAEVLPTMCCILFFQKLEEIGSMDIDLLSSALGADIRNGCI